MASGRTSTVERVTEAAARALALRGVVMLSVPDDERRWCAVCAAVDGSLELRVGEPSRGWRRRRPGTGEAWLGDHGFVHVLDAWALPAPRRATARFAAETLTAALEHALGVAPDAELGEVLVHPGVLGDTAIPAPHAPHGDHVRVALTALAARGRRTAATGPCPSTSRPSRRPRIG